MIYYLYPAAMLLVSASEYDNGPCTAAVMGWLYPVQGKYVRKILPPLSVSFYFFRFFLFSAKGFQKP